ncbi:MAG: hypothetical protein IJC25_04695 [Clostridia bacterium]|nr:hypothetical protein [Clostridia bacterium]
MNLHSNLYGDGVHDDTVALQTLLDNGGTVRVPKGTYLISQSLLIGDDTCLQADAGAVFRLADGACCTMLKSMLSDRSGRNRRITVDGGLWDGNNTAQTRGAVEGKAYFFGVIMRFEGVEDLTVRNVIYRDPVSYALQIMDADRFSVENVTFDFNMLRPNMDGVHVQGPARNGDIRNVKGATNDDLVALNCDDIYDDGRRTKGDIENITVDGLYAENGYTAVRLLSCGSRLQNVSIRNVFGTYRYYGVSFTHHNVFPGAPVWFDGVDIDGVYCSKPRDPYADMRCVQTCDTVYGAGTHDWGIRECPPVWFAKGVTCGNVSIANLHRVEECAMTEAPTVRIDPEVHIERLVLRNCTQRFVGRGELPMLVNNGTVDTMVCVD